MSYINLHCHTDFSNLRLIDSINKVSTLIDYAHEIGLKGIAITEHESVSSHIKAEKHLQKRRKENPEDELWQNFKLIRGNEIYLVRSGLNEQNFQSGVDRYYHFILLAKDAIGHKQLRQLSSRAWKQSWFRFMRRVPTYYSDVEEIIGSDSGHIIASTACIGGFLGQKILEYGANSAEKATIQAEIVDYIEWAQKVFGKENFFLELQPSHTEEQIYVNNEIVKLAQWMGIELIITTDAHYLKESDRPIHKAYLNSKDGDREVDDFYASTYLMKSEEIHQYMDEHIAAEIIDKCLENTLTIGAMCEEYSLTKPIKLPYIPKRKYDESILHSYIVHEKVPMMKQFIESPHDSDRHLVIRLLEARDAGKLFKSDDLLDMRYARINEELNSLWVSSEKQNVRWSAYLLQMADYIDIFWNDGDTIVGPGRGSGAGFYINYLLGITQIDPTREKVKTYSWRFLNPERASVLDIDTDIQGSRREQVISALRKHYGKDRVVKVMTVGTEQARSAIQTACRGLGVDTDVAQYLSSMIASERGIQQTLTETFYGDEEKGLASNNQFVREMTNNYPEVWKIAQGIEGLISRVGQHSGGVIVVDEDFEEASAMMTTTKGDIVSQFELHDEEEVGHIKIDCLAVEALDKVRVCLDLLVAHDYISAGATLRDTYEQTIGVYNLERSNLAMWEMVWKNQVISLFQMDQNSGVQAISLTQPQSVEDLATINSVMRLMATERGAEQPLSIYSRFKNDISNWYKEMEAHQLTKEQQQLLQSFLDYEYGICATQEDLMSIIQHPLVGGMSLSFADRCRKAIAKKIGGEFEACEREFFTNAKEKDIPLNFAHYVWNVLFKIQRGYSFCAAHTLAYSMIGLQELNLAYRFPVLFWNTANLIVDSGGADEGVVDEWEEEEAVVGGHLVEQVESSEEEEGEETDEPAAAVKKVANKTVNYGKISSAIGKMISRGITIELPNINKSTYTFLPDVETNSITYGIKGITRIGDNLVKEIISNRPYKSLDDFLSKIKLNILQIINLIKSGIFDNLERKDRRTIMEDFLLTQADTKVKLTLQNMPMLIRENLIPEEMAYYGQLFSYNKDLKLQKRDNWYILSADAFEFFSRHFDVGDVRTDSGDYVISQALWDKIYKKAMEPMRLYLKDETNGMIKKVNAKAIAELMKKYADGSISKWEMDSLGFYFGEHELKNVDKEYYNIKNFFDLPEDPVPSRIIPTKNGPIVLFDLCRIAGTVINKEKTKHILTLLTEEGVVNVKVWAAQFTKYDKQISVKQDDGKKKIMERSWFTRGNKLLITGIRRGDVFIPKIYKSGPYQEPFLFIEQLNEDGSLKLKYSRYDDV